MANDKPTLFYKSVEWALKNYTKPLRLGEQSPLATPYILGEKLATTPNRPEERGQILQELIRQGIAKMSGDKSAREQEVLTQYYVNGLSETAALDQLSMSKFPFHRLRRSAIDSLTAVLIDELRPAVRLERPPMAPTSQYGRSDEQKQCLAALQSNKQIWITGAGGIGKSTLASSLANSWPEERVFWLTIRIGLNDHVQHIAFALGYFLAKCGYPALWQECVADKSIVSSERMVPIIRHALEQLQQSETPVLVCIDDIDQLQRTQNADHEQIIRLLTSLRSLAAFLFIGQRATTDADEFFHLTSLSADLTHKWLRDAALSPSSEQLQALYSYTQGNPRLIELMVALYNRGVSIDDLLHHLREAPGIEFLVERILSNCDQNERAVLIELSIFRGAAPLDAWSKKAAQEAIHGLGKLRLVESYAQGQLTFHPVYRDIIYRGLSTEQLQVLHLWAAEIFESRGDYTSAIHHWVQAGNIENAVALWRRCGVDEINRGQAHTAYQIFSQMDKNHLSTEVKSYLPIVLAELEQFLGNSQQARTTLELIVAQTPLTAIIAANMQGEIANDFGEFERAQEFFKESLRLGEQLIESQLAKAYKGRAWASIRQRELDQAYTEALHARYEVENIQGYLLENRHLYLQAIDHYQAALALADELAHEEGIARTSLNLARLYSWLGNYDEAATFQLRTEQSYKRLGKSIAIIGALINRAFMQNGDGNHQSAIDTLNDAKELSAALDEALPTWPQALIAQNYAEAYLGLDQLALAEESARQAIAFEEEGVLADAYRTFGEIMHQQGKLDLAEEFIRNSIDLLEQSAEPDQYLLGYAWRALARLYTTQAETSKAKKAQAHAITLFREINLPNEVSRTEI